MLRQPPPTSDQRVRRVAGAPPPRVVALPTPDPEWLAHQDAEGIPTAGESGALVSRAPTSSDVAPSDGPIVWADELAKPLAPIAWLSEVLRISAGRPTMIAGEGGVKKSLAGEDIALSVAAGVPIFGVYSTRKARTLYLDAEQTLRITAERAQRMARAKGFELGDLGRSFGYAWSPTQLDAADAFDVLCRMTDEIGLCVIDSYRPFAPSIDENSSAARRPLDLLTQVSAKTGVAFVVLDHSGKPPGDDTKRTRRHAVRGSSAKVDATSTLYIMSGERGEPSLVTCEREQNTGCPPSNFYLTVEDVARDGDSRWGLRLVHQEIEQIKRPARPSAFGELKTRILETLKSEPGLSKNAIAARVKGNRQNTLQAVNELVDEKTIAVIDGGHRVV